MQAHLDAGDGFFGKMAQPWRNDETFDLGMKKSRGGHIPLGGDFFSRVGRDCKGRKEMRFFHLGFYWFNSPILLGVAFHLKENPLQDAKTGVDGDRYRNKTDRVAWNPLNPERNSLTKLCQSGT